MGHAISDERAREAVDRLRKVLRSDNKLDERSDVHALIMYVAERLPVETVRARDIHYYVPYGNPGTRSRVELGIAEERMPDFIKTLMEDDAASISISPAYDKPIR